LSEEEEEEEGLHGVFKRLRRNGHQLKKEAANSSTLFVCTSKYGLLEVGTYTPTAPICAEVMTSREYLT
jgi:hypothetical protein